MKLFFNFFSFFKLNKNFNIIFLFNKYLIKYFFFFNFNKDKGTESYFPPEKK
jgi:hypothetical protein